jgi:hypothetical protein
MSIVIQTAQYKICDVHRLIDYDTTSRLCTYCNLCDAWICQECQPQWGRRLKAAIKRKLEPGFRGDPSYTDKINEKGELVQ